MGQIKLSPFNSRSGHKFVVNRATPEIFSATTLFSSTGIQDFIAEDVVPVDFNSFELSDFPFYMADDDDSDHIVRITIDFMRINDGVKPEIEVFGAENAGVSNIPGVSGGAGGWGADRGERGRVSINPINNGGIMPGDNFFARVRRTPGVGGDNAIGAMKWLPTMLNYI